MMITQLNNVELSYNSSSINNTRNQSLIYNSLNLKVNSVNKMNPKEEEKKIIIKIISNLQIVFIFKGI